jgi:hypothetical protein
MHPEVLDDEEDKQLVTYERGLVQGYYNGRPAREETYLLLHACCRKDWHSLQGRQIFGLALMASMNVF